MANKEFLKRLLETPSPSGCEELGIEVWQREMTTKLGLPYYKDKMGNTAFSVGNGPTKVMFSGHIDEICMSVCYITENGFLIPKNMGGVDKKVLPGSAVLILREPNLESVEGVVHKNPIHIEYQEEKLKNKVLDFDDLRIDIGAESKEEVESLGIHVGSPIVHGRILNLEFGSHRVHGNSLDDKAGVFVVSEVMKRLAEYTNESEWWNKYTIIGCACTGEESGLLGAHKVARQINPDISVDLDVLHACDTKQFEPKKYGEVKLGEGPVITWGQDKSRRLNKILGCGGIKTQDGAERIGGTNTKEFYLEGSDTESTLLSLPLLSMHTPIETMDWRDIEGAIELLTSTTIECKW